MSMKCGRLVVGMGWMKNAPYAIRDFFSSPKRSESFWNPFSVLSYGHPSPNPDLSPQGRLPVPYPDLSPQGRLLGPESWPLASRPITGPISWPLALRRITGAQILTSRLKVDYRSHILTSRLKADYWGPNRDLSPQGRLVELCLHGALCLLCMQKCNLTCILLCCTRFRNPEGMRRFRSDVKMKLKETGPTL